MCVCPGGCLPRGVSAQGGVHPGGCLPGGVCPVHAGIHTPFLVNRMTERQVLKILLSATSFADCNKSEIFRITV